MSYFVFQFIFLKRFFMSGAMESAMRFWERGLSVIPNTLVCNEHFKDYAIKKFIRRDGIKGRCDYCSKSKVVLQLEELLIFLTDALMHFYKDPANFMSYDSREGGYQGQVDDAMVILEDLGLEINDAKVYDDIYRSFDNTGWSEEYGNEHHFRNEMWNNFKYLVKNKSRFLLTTDRDIDFGGGSLNPFDFLKEISKVIKSQKMIRVIPSGTTLFRFRQHRNFDDIIDISGLCSPPEKFVCQPNRMSPSGISIFYCALSPSVAYRETIDSTNEDLCYYSVGEFKTIYDLIIVDFSLIPDVPSPFDQNKWHIFYLIKFLHDFVDDLSKDIKRDGKEHVEYVPTQILTEYFRYRMKLNNGAKINGIAYPSSKSIFLEDVAVVLFMDHFESQNSLNLIKKESKPVK